MTSVFGAFRKRGTTDNAMGSVVPEFPNVLSGLPGRMSPMEIAPGWVTGDLSG